MSIDQKGPVARTLSTLVGQRARAEIQKRWLELPGNILSVNATATAVTVNFDIPGLSVPQATMPVAMSKYARFPLQKGDPGIAVSASAYLGSVSGLGTGSPAAAALQPNLANLVWIPISNAKWASVSAQNHVLTDATGASVITLAPTGITLAFGGHSVVINSSGVTIDGKVFLAHEHTAGTLVAGSTAVTGITGAVD